jgi:transposase InsO family protein
MVGPAAKRAAVAHLQDTMGLSERRACSIAGADRTMVRYRSCRPPDTALRARLRELANERRRFGYRRPFVLLRREGEPSGINRIHRLYREEGLAVRKRRARRKAIGVRVPTRIRVAAWVADYNDERPHSSLTYLTPAAYAATFTATGDRLRNPDQLRRSPVALPAPHGVQNPETLTAAG